MTDQSRAQRLEEALRKARLLFVKDAALRMEAANRCIRQYENREIEREQLGKELYAFVHTLRGVAITVGCAEVDSISSSALRHIIQHESTWTIESMDQLLHIIAKLEAEIGRLAIT